MTKLKTETNTKAIEERILKAFRAIYPTFARKTSTKSIEAFFDCGQWYVIAKDELNEDSPETHYSVVDAEGGRSVDGFDFEVL